VGNSQPKDKSLPQDQEEKSAAKPLVFPSRRLVAFWPSFPSGLRQVLETRGYWIDVVGSSEALFESIANHRVDLIFYHVASEQDRWKEDLARILHASMSTRFVVMMESPSPLSIVHAMKLGAAGAFGINDSADIILSELESDTSLPPSLPPLKLHSGTILVGQSEAIRHLRALMDRLQTADSTVLITGESGTGKELIARAIHESSQFKSGPFRAVNCGAIPENLLESELFGHVKGAFTDAKADHKGIFEACNGGTLLLDEVGDMPISLQVKLLRVLEERQITPVGSTEPLQVNVRVLASTNRELDELVAEGKFRRDLFFRLAVVRFRLPPLRERREDIPLLVNQYREHFCKRFERPMPPISHEVWSRLLAYDWPGNVRELRNVIERSVALSADGQLQLEDVLPTKKEEKLAFPQFCPLNPVNSNPATFQEVKTCCEKSYLTRLLQLSEGARLSGRHRTEVYRQLEKLSLDPKKFQKS
jgi:two-component system response regulator GlrR